MSASNCILLLVITLGLVYAKDSCPKLKPAEGLQISEIFGTWYAVRGIEHVNTTSTNSPKQTKSCPVIKIISKDNVIEFQWHSKDKPQKKLELKPNKDNPTLLEPTNKKGNSKNSLQITSVDKNKSVIGVTMCKSGGRIASVILNRNPTFTKDEVETITNNLASQGLNVNNIYDRCIKSE